MLRPAGPGRRDTGRQAASRAAHSGPGGAAPAAPNSSPGPHTRGRPGRRKRPGRGGWARSAQRREEAPPGARFGRRGSAGRREQTKAGHGWPALPHRRALALQGGRGPLGRAQEPELKAQGAAKEGRDLRTDGRVPAGRSGRPDRSRRQGRRRAGVGR